MARLTAKVSEKGAVSVIGLGRFPVTLYSDQWKELAPCVPAILAFIEANKDKLSVKEDKAGKNGASLLAVAG